MTLTCGNCGQPLQWWRLAQTPIRGNQPGWTHRTPLKRHCPQANPTWPRPRED